MIPLFTILFPFAVFVAWTFSEKGDPWFDVVKEMFIEMWTGKCKLQRMLDKGLISRNKKRILK